MPDDEAASHGGWQVRGEPWDLLVPPPEQPLAQLRTWATAFSPNSQREHQKPNCSYSSPSSSVSHNTTFAIGIRSCKTSKETEDFCHAKLGFSSLNVSSFFSPTNLWKKTCSRKR